MRFRPQILLSFFCIIGNAAFGQIPITLPDFATTQRNAPVTIAVLGNDLDILATIDPGTVDLDISTGGVQSTLVTTEGTFEADAAGVVTFTPATDYTGNAQNSYTVANNINITSLPALISVTVNDPPVANDDGETTLEDTPVSTKVTSNDTDSDGNVVVGSVDLDPGAGGQQMTITITEGTFTVNNGGIVTYTPEPNFQGPTASIKYTVLDNDGGLSNEATLTITITPVNDGPVANPDAAVTNEDVAVAVNVILNDMDIDGVINPATVDLDLAMGGIQTTHTVTGEGTFVSDGAGVVTFTPVSNYDGPSSTPYTVQDNSGATSAPAFINITIDPVNDPPKAVDDAITTNEGIPVTLNVVSNDTDPENNINAASVDLDVSTPGSIDPTITTTAGSWSVNSTGVVSFTPTAVFNGDAVLKYTVNDTGGATSNQGTITITVTPVNDPPHATDDAATTGEELTVMFNVVTNDTDEDGTVNPASVDLDVSTIGIQNSNSNDDGSYSVNASGVVTFSPAPDFADVTTLQYTVNDNNGATSNVATITVTVTAVNDPPEAHSDAATTPEEVATTVNVVANDTDEDGSINASTVDLDTSTPSIQNSRTITNVGTFTVSNVGIVTFTPNTDYAGPATISYTVNDNEGATSNAATIAITVTQVNDPPKAFDDAASTTEETQVTVNVVANDTDIDGTINPATVDLNTSSPGIQGTATTTAGSYSVNAAGVVTFTPATNITGPATLSYTVNDNSGATSAPATITIDVDEVNDPPSAMPDAATTNEDVAVTVNVVANDTDGDGSINASTVDLNTTMAGIQGNNSVTGGSFSVSNTGVVTFTPTLNYATSPVTVSYTVNDNDGATSNAATISITITPVNDAPEAVADAASGNEGATVTINILTNDSDVDGNLVASTVDLDTSIPGIQTTHSTTGGTFSISSPGVVAFTPLSTFNGSTSISYTVNDNGGATSNAVTITVTINAVNDPPVANDDVASTTEDNAVIFSVVGNDTDEDGTVNAATVDLNTSLAGIQPTNTVTAGTFTVNASGVVTYTPATNYAISPVTLPYRVNDNDGATSNTANITITITAVNDAPEAKPDAVTGNEDAVSTINVVSNDIDVDGTINASTVDLEPGSAGIQNTATISGGTISVSPAGLVTFTPTVNFYGQTTASYTVNDNGGATSNTTTITFTVNAVNDPPIANNDITSANENETVTLNVVANDIDIDGTINAATVDLNPAAGGIQITRTVTAGTFTVSAGVVTYVPATNYNGLASITYTVQDDAGTASNAATITVTVASVNSDPVAVNDAATTNEDTPVSLNVVTNDNDPDGTINAATVDLNTATAGIQNSFTSTDGTYTVNASGVVTFTPASNFNNPSSVTYTVNDNVGATSNVATIAITITPVNDPPVANNDAASTPEKTAVTINVVANDTDVEGALDPSTVDLDTSTPGIQNSRTVTNVGAYTVSNTGIVTFTPGPTFSGATTLNYRVNDSGGATSNAATISITVNAVNDPPVAVPDVATTNEDASVTFSVVANDTDEDGTINASTVDLNPATAGIQSTRAVTEGNFSVNSSGVVTFTPASNINTPVSISYTVNDNGGLTSNEAAISITINAVNDPPVAGNDVATTSEDVAVTFNVVANDSDVDGTVNAASVDLNTTLSGIQITNTVTGGTFTVNAQGDVTFTPVANYSGSAAVNYRVSDNAGLSSGTASITVTINAVNDPPVFNEIANQRVLWNSGQKTISITGISPGPSESESLLLNASSANTSLVPHPSIVYNGTAATASLSFTPAAGQSGTADITVKVIDTGLNEFTRTFQIEVVEVRIISTPGTVAVIGDPTPYVYNIDVTAGLPETLTITAPQKPSWLTLTSTGKNKAKLQGTPPGTAATNNPVRIQVKDGATVLDEQAYTLVVNHRPTVAAFATTANEDEPKAFAQQDFVSAFTDVDGNALSNIRISRLPLQGTLLLNGSAVVQGQQISYAAIPGLTYTSALDYSGSDILYWKGGDPYTFSVDSVALNITIAPVNDAPRITALETDSLKYEVGSALPRVMTTLFDAIDVDDTFLTGAEIGFRHENFRPSNDQLIFINSENITGVYDDLSGILTLTGTAPVAEYVEAIRGINYNFINFNDIVHETKKVYITLTDGKADSEAEERNITLIYTFESLDIPNAFTPDGNGANDEWKITAGLRGVEQYNEAVVRIYNRRGTLVYETIGFDTPWNGMMNGEVLPADTYYYTIDLKYNKFTYKGIVTILR